MKYKYFFMSLLFGLVEGLMITILLITRSEHVTHDYWTISYVYLASLWAWIAPIIIYHYEVNLIPSFIKNYGFIAKNKQNYHAIRKKYEKPVTSNISAKIFLIIWIVSIIYVFIDSYNFMKGFGIISTSDYWWYTLIGGVILYAYLTGLGFLFVARTIFLSTSLLKLEVEIDPLSIDNRGGLGFIGETLSQVSLIFASGALYIPILLNISEIKYNQSLPLPEFLVATYTFMILLSFTYPLTLFRNKIFLEKNRNLIRLKNTIYIYKEKINLGKNNYKLYRIYCDEYDYTFKLETWPFDTGDITRVVGSFILPIILAVYQVSPQTFFGDTLTKEIKSVVKDIKK